MRILSVLVLLYAGIVFAIHIYCAGAEAGLLQPFTVHLVTVLEPRVGILTSRNLRYWAGNVPATCGQRQSSAGVDRATTTAALTTLRNPVVDPPN